MRKEYKKELIENMGRESVDYEAELLRLMERYSGYEQQIQRICHIIDLKDSLLSAHEAKMQDWILQFERREEINQLGEHADTSMGSKELYDTLTKLTEEIEKIHNELKERYQKFISSEEIVTVSDTMKTRLRKWASLFEDISVPPSEEETYKRIKEQFLPLKMRIAVYDPPWALSNDTLERFDKLQNSLIDLTAKTGLSDKFVREGLGEEFFSEKKQALLEKFT